MTNELEKTFFDTFGIEPEYTYLVTDTFYTNNAHTYTATKDDLIDYLEDKNCGRYKVIEVYKNYPQITDHILLELICIVNHKYVYIEVEGTDIKTMKNNLLLNFIHFKRIIPEQQVRTLFEE